MRYIAFVPSLGAAVPKSAMIRARMEPALKRRAEAMLEQLGLSPTTAITLFYRQIIQQRGLPFDLRVPSVATQRAMQDARSGRGVVRPESRTDLFAQLDAGNAKRPPHAKKRRIRSDR